MLKNKFYKKLLCSVLLGALSLTTFSQVIAGASEYINKAFINTLSVEKVAGYFTG